VLINLVWLNTDGLFSGRLIGTLNLPQSGGSAGEHIQLFALSQRTPAVHLIDDRGTQLWKIDCSGAPIAACTRWAQLTTWL
jgi:hypothetical protein